MNALIVRLSALGDVVLTTSVLDLLHQMGWTVHYLTRPAYAGLFLGDPRVARVWTPQELEILRAIPFDLALDLQAKPLTWRIMRRLSAKRKGRVRKRSLARRLAVWLKHPLEEIPMYRLHCEALGRALGRPLPPCPPPRLLTVGKKPPDLPDRYGVLAPEGGFPTKEWPEEKWRELAHLLLRHLPLVVVGTRPDGLFQGLDGTVLDFRGRTEVSELVEIIRSAAFLVGNDSGPAHIAAAVGTPTFVLFGPTIPAFGFRPAGPGTQARVFEIPLPCRPCSLHGEKPCRRKDRACLAWIRPDEVAEAVRETLYGT